MFGPESRNAPNIAIITLVCGWVFTALAILAVILFCWSRRLLGMSLSKNDCVVFGPLVMAIVLVGHTSWAVIEEGMGRRQVTLSKSQRASLVKVSFRCASTVVPMAVSLTKGSTVNNGK